MILISFLGALWVTVVLWLNENISPPANIVIDFSYSLYLQGRIMVHLNIRVIFLYFLLFIPQ